MAVDRENPNSTAELRADAVAQVAARAVASAPLSDLDVKRLYHELQVHQVELEMQNKALHLTKLELEATRDSYFALYDLAPVGYLTLNKDGLIQKANLTAVTMLGVERDALTNKPIQKFIFSDDVDSYYLQSRSAVEAAEDFTLELRFMQADGSPFWVSLQASLQNDDGFWIAFNDISIRKQLEQSLRQANETLEEQVAYRTNELSKSVTSLEQENTERKKAEAEKANLEYRLNQAQKMEAIGQLAGGVAHDFNNKLMAILGNAELAKMDIHDSDMVMNYLNEIRRAAEHSRDITYRLLAFSRQQVVTPQVLDANKIIADALKSLSRLIGEHISIAFEPCDKLWNIRMDPVQLDQVVMNLAINARDAMPDGGSLIIETRNTTCDISSSSSIDAIPGDYVMVTFSDTGTGMDKKTLKHIFEPFFTTKEVGKGTGLGLATIYGIILQNSGFIDVASNVGYGTEFRIYIPRFSAPKTETAKIADSLYSGSCSILLVEDEDAVRSVTSQFLRKIGYTVHEAATPRAALEFARDFSKQIDLVLTDFVMPEMNGRVMMEQILELRPQLQCIYASGFSTEHVLLSEEAHFIQKPYDFIKLSGYLKRVLGEREEQ
ncbi:MAG: ATP-binding protein [Desulfuromonadales bacterium]